MKALPILIVALAVTALPLTASPAIVLSTSRHDFIHGVDTTESVPKFTIQDESPSLPGLESLAPLTGVLKVIYSFGNAENGQAHSFPHFMHFGVDIAAKLGTKVVSVLDGTVKYAAFNEDFGYFVLVAHRQGYVTIYGHLAWLVVKTGQAVSMGTVLGYVGETGLVTEPALHFAIVKDGLVYFDPGPLLRR